MSDSLRALAERGVLRKLAGGAQIIIEGDRGDTLFIVLVGGLRAFGAGADGRKVVFSEYGPGEYVGEMGLDGGPRSAHVETVCATTVAMVTRPTLEAHLRADPDFAFELLGKVIGLARNATWGMKSIALVSTYGRLKAQLEQHRPASPKEPWCLHASQRQISERIGCSRPMVSRLLKDLAAGGVVVLERQKVTVLKPLPADW